MNIPKLIELNEIVRADAVAYPHRRALFSILQGQKGRHFTGIAGPRGVGKTVLLKQMLGIEPNAFYLSLDTLPRETDLFELIRKLAHDYQYKMFLLDEIHFQPGIMETLKNLYDFLKIRLIFTSSVALAMAQSAHDLSRRAVVMNLYPFSFREYLFFNRGKTLSGLTLEQIISKEWSSEHIRAGFCFEDYVRGGLMPFSLEEPDSLALLQNILDTIIARDIPTVARLHIDELDVIRKVVSFIGRSAVDGINYTSVARNLGITKYKAEQYIDLLEKAFVLQRVFPKGTNLLKEPKVLMALPYRLLFREFEDCIGGLREDFFAEVMRHCGMDFYYLKSTRGAKTPDFLLDDGKSENTVIEIGGKGKGREQFKGVVADRKIIFSAGDACDGMRRPLFMLGFLE